jgi:hypothetical protein
MLDKIFAIVVLCSILLVVIEGRLATVFLPLVGYLFLQVSHASAEDGFPASPLGDETGIAPSAFRPYLGGLDQGAAPAPRPASPVSPARAAATRASPTPLDLQSRRSGGTPRPRPAHKLLAPPAQQPPPPPPQQQQQQQQPPQPQPPQPPQPPLSGLEAAPSTLPLPLAPSAITQRESGGEEKRPEPTRGAAQQLLSEVPRGLLERKRGESSVLADTTWTDVDTPELLLMDDSPLELTEVRITLRCSWEKAVELIWRACDHFDLNAARDGGARLSRLGVHKLEPLGPLYATEEEDEESLFRFWNRDRSSSKGAHAAGGTRRVRGEAAGGGEGLSSHSEEDEEASEEAASSHLHELAEAEFQWNAGLKFRVTKKYRVPSSGWTFTHRAVHVETKVPLLVRKLLGEDGQDYVLLDERARQHEGNRLLEFQSVSRTFSRFVVSTERREYRVHPDNPEWTLFTQSGKVYATAACGLMRSTVRRWAQKSFQQRADASAAALEQYVNGSASAASAAAKR